MTKTIVEKMVFTRGDESTKPGGIILRKMIDNNGCVEWVSHHFTRRHGELVPVEFFWGSYHRNHDNAIRSFQVKVERNMLYDRGGSIISNDELLRELAREKRMMRL